jgi:hypothetical protein
MASYHIGYFCRRDSETSLKFRQAIPSDVR